VLVAAPGSDNAVVAAAVLVGGGVVVVAMRGADEVTANARVNPHGNPIDAKINTKKKAGKTQSHLHTRSTQSYSGFRTRFKLSKEKCNIPEGLRQMMLPLWQTNAPQLFTLSILKDATAATHRCPRPAAAASAFHIAYPFRIQYLSAKFKIK
jgi:hypothetical protein